MGSALRLICPGYWWEGALWYFSSSAVAKVDDEVAPDLADEDPLDLYFSYHDYTVAICFDCAKDAYIVLESSRRRVAETKKKARKTGKTK